MKRNLIALLACLLFPMSIFAGDFAPMGQTAVAQQSYRAADVKTTVVPPAQTTAAVKPASQKTTSSDSAELAKVQAVMAAAKRYQAAKRAGTQTKATLPAPKDEATAQHAANDLSALTTTAPDVQASTQPAIQPLPQQTTVVMPVSQSIAPAQNADAKMLESQLTRLSQVNLLFQQAANHNIELLTARNQALEAQIIRLNKALILMNNELTQVAARINQAKDDAKFAAQSPPGESWFQRFDNQLGSNFKYGLYAGIVLVLIVLTVVLRSRGKKSSSSHPVEADTGDEYDFMGSKEAIPAKLDLARAYLAMDDFASAKTALEEVMDNGSEEEQRQAQEILDEITRRQ